MLSWTTVYYQCGPIELCPALSLLDISSVPIHQAAAAFVNAFCSAEAGAPTAIGADQRDLLSPNKPLVKIERRCENSVQVERGPSYTFRGRLDLLGTGSVLRFPFLLLPVTLIL